MHILAGELKICKGSIQTVQVNKFFFKKNWRMRILSACIFLSLLAGKLNLFKQMLTRKRINSRSNKVFISDNLIAKEYSDRETACKVLGSQIIQFVYKFLAKF